MDFAHKELGLALYPGQAAVLDAFEAGGYSEAVIQCGRQSGKSLMADVLALYTVLVREKMLRRYLRPGQPLIAAIVAPSDAQAMRHIRNCANMIAHSAWASFVVRQTADELEFANGSIIAAYPCSGRGLRGGTWACVVLDEFGHFLDSDGSNSAGDEVLSSAEPALATFQKAGWLVMISTPKWRQGAFWEKVKRAATGDFPYMYYTKQPSTQMNPTTLEVAERKRLEDPDEYAQEYLAEFIEGTSSYLPYHDVAAARREGGILPPRTGFRYVAAIDPAYQHDNFALAVGHKEGDRLIVDGVWTWWRKGHEFTISEIASLCHVYGVQEVRTDQHAPVPIREALERHKIAVKYVPWTNESKAEAFNRLKVNLSLRQMEIPDDQALVDELLSLEARPTVGGFTRIAGVGGKDDRAVVVASVVQALELGDGFAIIFAGDDQGPSDELDAWTRRLSGSSVF